MHCQFVPDITVQDGNVGRLERTPVRGPMDIKSILNEWCAAEVHRLVFEVETTPKHTLAGRRRPLQPEVPKSTPETSSFVKISNFSMHVLDGMVARIALYSQKVIW